MKMKIVLFVILASVGSSSMLWGQLAHMAMGSTSIPSMCGSPTTIAPQLLLES